MAQLAARTNRRQFLKMSNPNHNPMLTPEQKTANRLALAAWDMYEASRHLRAYDDLEGRQSAQGTNEFEHHCEAILSAAIVAYCRPFKGSNSDGFADRSVLSNSLAAVQARLVLHKLVVTKRDKFIAHADWDARSTEMKMIGSTIVRHYPNPSVYAGLDLAEFRELITTVRQECQSKANAIDSTFGEALARLANKEGQAPGSPK
jgi:hypothetical protein